VIVGLFTGLLGAGGIERISRHAAAVLSQFAREGGRLCSLLSLNDPRGHHRVRVGDMTFTFEGFGRSKYRFVRSVLTSATKARLAYLNHPNLAPLGLVIQVISPASRYIVATYGIDVWRRLPLYRYVSLCQAAAVTALSSFTADAVTRIQRVKSGRVFVVPPALDPEFVDAVATVQHPDAIKKGSRILLTVARLAASERYKGIETVIEALPRVLRVVPDVHYVVVGDGDDRGRLERLAAEKGVRERVLFTGAKFGEELARQYAKCDVFVMPSRGEGFGVVFLEAMAYGKPVIGGDHGGTPDIIQEGVNGFLVQYGDIDTLAERIIRLLTDDDLRKRMGDAGRRIVTENYTFEHFRQRLTRLLLEAESWKS
jgi:phosphatidylinositol alpha-1,6-mannosyltransferase